MPLASPLSKHSSIGSKSPAGGRQSPAGRTSPHQTNSTSKSKKLKLKKESASKIADLKMQKVDEVPREAEES